MALARNSQPMAAMPVNRRRMANRFSSHDLNCKAFGYARGRWQCNAAGWRACRETANWRATTSGIYFIGATANQPVIRRAPLTGGNAVDVAWLGNYSWPGFAITPDGARGIYAHWDRRESNIMGWSPTASWPAFCSTVDRDAQLPSIVVKTLLISLCLAYLFCHFLWNRRRSL